MKGVFSCLEFGEFPMGETAINLNQKQKVAAEEFFQFLFSNDKEFIISGSAGVGKTLLMGYLIDVIMPRYLEMCKILNTKPDYDQVIMTATTNKAASVLAHSTQRPTQTIHSFLNLTVKEDFSNGRTILTKTRSWTVHENLILFIDEASLIDSALYKILQEGTANCKIVYVGDHNQLAPVMEKISPIYRQGAPFYELTEQMRNNGQPALMAVCEQLKRTVETGVFEPIELVPGVIDLLDDDTMLFGIDTVFKEQTDRSRILAYTNDRVIQFNNHIRTNVRNLPVEYQQNDKLIMNSPFKPDPRNRGVAAEEPVVILKYRGRGNINVAPDVDIDVDYLDILDDFGVTLSNVPYPRDKVHMDQLKKYYYRIKQYDKYFWLRNSFPDLRPRDASTVHKSQGSTYDFVFIDMDNISTCRQSDQAARMLYVAFSRARERVYLHGMLAAKYGGYKR